MSEIISIEKPDFVFHLAAQPIVSQSYKDPFETISSNVIGTTNILEALKLSNHNCVAVLITSDKAYDNIEQLWGYKETDQLGGKDIYSGSKAAAELIIKSYYFSFFTDVKSNIRIGIGRAGNVIGGGDWAIDRIVVDCVKAWSENEVVKIRNPNATRPWQHVLEPLSGYLTLGQLLLENNDLHGEAFNFGPSIEQNFTVEELITDLSKYWDNVNQSEAFISSNSITFNESNLLKLNCEKASKILNWKMNLSYSENVRYTSEWYFDYYNSDIDMFEKTYSQINEYEDQAINNQFNWAI